MKLTVKQENAMDEEYKRQFLTLVKGKDISEIMSLPFTRVWQSVFTQNTSVLPLVLQVGSNYDNGGAHVRHV